MKDLWVSSLVEHALEQWLEVGGLDRYMMKIYPPFHGKLKLTGVDGKGFTFEVESPILIHADGCCNE